MRFYTTVDLGPKQKLTPEGFLVIEDVPLARTGTQIYGPYEIPVSAGPDGIVRIERNPEEVFRPETIASFGGKPLVNEHPEDEVNPSNWRDLACGTILHPRRGKGIDDDVLMADLIVTDAEAIQLIRDGKRELSCGYDADYIETGPGRGRQTNIVGNHVALVDTGRCGPRCAIGDQSLEMEVRPLAKTLGQRILDAFRSKNETALTTALEELPDDEQPQPTHATHVHVHTHDKDEEEEDDKKKKTEDKDDEEDDDKKSKFKDAIDKRLLAQDNKIAGIAKDVKSIKDAFEKKDDEEDKETKDEGALAFGAEAPPGTGDRAWAKDSSYMEESFQETVATAEIIAPGIGLPTFDAAAKPRKTYDALCGLRKRSLDVAYNTNPEVRSFMDEMMSGRSLKEYTCDGVRTMFRAVGIVARKHNKDEMRHVSEQPVGGGTGVKSLIKTPADLNKKMAEFYK